MRCRISIVIPTYNRAEMLRKCLNALGQQQFNPFEILVVDGGSVDQTEEVVNDFMKRTGLKVNYFRQDVGRSAARGLGVEHAMGEIVAFIDDDCVASENWLKSIVKHFSNETISGIEGMTIPVPKESSPFSHSIENTKGGKFCTCNMAYSKTILKKVEGFDERFGHREDSDLAFSILENGGKIEFKEDVLVYHPQYKETWLKKLKKMKYFYFDPLLLKKHPKLYKKYIRFPFYRFTPLYLMCTLFGLVNPWLLLSVFLLEVIEYSHRKWRFNSLEFLYYFPLQIIGSLVILIYVL